MTKPVWILIKAEGKASNYKRTPSSSCAYKMISRSGDECVVAALGQCLLGYGDEKWKAEAQYVLQQMNISHWEGKGQFEAMIDW